MFQIKITRDGLWHRRKHGSNDLTACGKTIGIVHFTRDWELDENLCQDGCFTGSERDTGEFVKLEREAVAARRAYVFCDDDPTPTDDITPLPPPPPVLDPVDPTKK